MYCILFQVGDSFLPWIDPDYCFITVNTLGINLTRQQVYSARSYWTGALNVTNVSHCPSLIYINKQRYNTIYGTRIQYSLYMYSGNSVFLVPTLISVCRSALSQLHSLKLIKVKDHHHHQQKKITEWGRGCKLQIRSFW